MIVCSDCSRKQTRNRNTGGYHDNLPLPEMRGGILVSLDKPLSQVWWNTQGGTMSIRFYRCDECNREFSLLVFMEYHTIKCVYCGGNKLSRIRVKTEEAWPYIFFLGDGRRNGYVLVVIISSYCRMGSICLRHVAPVVMVNFRGWSMSDDYRKRVLNPCTKDERNRLFNEVLVLCSKYVVLNPYEKQWVLNMVSHKIMEKK